jgi:hypothetical protein
MVTIAVDIHMLVMMATQWFDHRPLQIFSIKEYIFFLSHPKSLDS